MSEIITTREIIGIAHKSKWKEIKEFIKALVKITLNKEAGYALVVLDGTIQKKRKKEFSYLIQSNNQIKKIDEISSFGTLSLYQYTETSNDHINISQQNGVIILITKYMGPAINHHEYFDFAVHLDPIHDPFFTDSSGRVLSCSDIIKVINPTMKPKEKQSKTKPAKTKKRKPKKSKAKKGKAKSQPKQKKIIQNKNFEATIFEKLTGKKAIWGGNETKAYKSWKEKTLNKFKKEVERIAYYNGKPTTKYAAYLETLLNSKN